MSTPSTPPLSPQFRAWLEHEAAWGRQAVRAIGRQRSPLSGRAQGLDRFRLRMSLVELTGAVARWAHALGEALDGAGRAETAALFAVTPPFAATDPTSADCEQLAEYVELRISALRDVLAQDAA